MQKRDPGCSGYIGDYTSQLCEDYVIHHEIRIPIKQPVFHGKYPRVSESWLKWDQPCWRLLEPKISVQYLQFTLGSIKLFAVFLLFVVFCGLATLPKKTQKPIGKIKHKQNDVPNVGVEKIY